MDGYEVAERSALGHLVARADVCAAALADLFRGDGEILANPIGILPMIGGRLARATYEPDLMMTDGEAALVTNNSAIIAAGAEVVEAYNPYRSMFDLVWSGRRHVVMGASQLDQFGNQNIAALGPNPDQPRTQLLGYRGAPGNTISHTTSYWIGAHNRRVLVPAVDQVTGVGNHRAAQLGAAGRFHDLRAVVTDLAVLDFVTPDGRMRLRSVHPGVQVADVVAATGFDLVIGAVTETRLPSPAELELLEDVIDRPGARHQEVSG